MRDLLVHGRSLNLAAVCKITARAFRVLACRIGAEGYQIDAFGADLFILLAANEPQAQYLLVGSRAGSITLSGPGPGHVYRDGSGAGHARRAGSGPGCALRSGAGTGHAYRDGHGDGSAIRAGTGSGHAINHSAGVGNAWREGSGAGDAVRSGEGQGHAYRLDNGQGQALRNGQGHGDALHFGRDPGLTARLDAGVGQTWSMAGALARRQAIYSPQRKSPPLGLLPSLFFVGLTCASTTAQTQHHAELRVFRTGPVLRLRPCDYDRHWIDSTNVCPLL